MTLAVLFPGDNLLPDTLSAPVERGTLFSCVMDVFEDRSDVSLGVDENGVLEELDGGVVDDDIGDDGGIEAVTFRT